MTMMQEPMNMGEMVMHHAGDAYSIGLEPFWEFHWSPDLLPTIHVGSLAINLTPTKHVVFMLLAATIVAVTMILTGRSLKKQRANEQAPKGFAGMIEALVLYVRNDIAIAAMGEEAGKKYAPLILSFFFFILAGNLLGMLPWGAAFTSNLGVTIGLALITFLVVEIGGFLKLGPSGYMHTIFPTIGGMSKGGATAVSIFMGPIEIIGKLTKPLALALRLFGNILAGHFVVLSFLGLIFVAKNMMDAPAMNWGVGIGTVALVTAIMLLELVVSFVQAYVFALLTAVFIGMMQEHH